MENRESITCNQENCREGTTCNQENCREGTTRSEENRKDATRCEESRAVTTRSEENREGTTRSEEKSESTTRCKDKVIYSVEDVPPPHLCFLFGLQQAIMCIGSSLSIPYILTALLCAQGQSDVTAKLLSITMFMSGVATLLQTTVGIRLPVIQGGSHTFIPPIVTMMTLEKFKCSAPVISGVSGNSSNITDDWTIRMREIQGSLILASITQVIVGCTGLIGFVMHFVGPLTIAPTISLIGLSLTGVVSEFCDSHWGISILTAALVLLFSVYVNRIRIPLPAFTTEKKCHITKFPIFQLFPVLLSIGIVWLLCYILTITDVFPNDAVQKAYKARTDSKLNVVSDVPWFYFPVPFQFGPPTFSAAVYVGMLAATISSIMESVGDYFVSAGISDVAPPPPHALNRGIAMEGIASICSGIAGAGHATTTYSNNIGMIGITKVASRSVFTTAAVIMIVCGVIGKFGAILALIPEPIIGGTLLIGLGMVVSVGISVLQFSDMSSMRNITVLGVSFLAGLMIPEWISAHPQAINTGSEDFNQVIQVLLGTASFTGGFIGFFLDNTVPGTIEERGIKKWRFIPEKKIALKDNDDLKIYEIPFITKYLHNTVCSYIPFSPVFDGEIHCNCRRGSSGQHRYSLRSDRSQDSTGDHVVNNGAKFHSIENGQSVKYKQNGSDSLHIII